MGKVLDIRIHLPRTDDSGIPSQKYRLYPTKLQHRFANPHIAQVEIIKNEGEKGITFHH